MFQVPPIKKPVLLSKLIQETESLVFVGRRVTLSLAIDMKMVLAFWVNLSVNMNMTALTTTWFDSMAYFQVILKVMFFCGYQSAIK